MQHTLLGLGIALILALVTALVGPLLIDWGRYRAGFESEASRMAGLPVRIGGGIDVRILPTPTIALRDVEVGSRAAPVFGAQVARVELSLSSLMKGEWRAGLLTLEAPDISFGLDPDGQIVARNAAPGVDLERISIDRIAVTQGTLALEDATSGARILLDKLSFAGEMRSLAGAVKGEGAFVSAGQPYKYRIATGRNADAGLRFHFNLDPVDRPLSFETDGLVTLERGAPHYDGTLSIARLAGVELAGGKTVAGDPWRVTGKVKADVRNALFEQIELNYGPEERVIRLTGTASMNFGKRPDFNSVLSARQVDLDRALASPDAASRLPLAALRGLTEALGAFGQLPMPARFGIDIDSVTLSGAVLQAVRGDLQFEGSSWSIENFEFRAPGYTQVALSGRIDEAGGAEFSGPVSVDSADPRALLSWLEGFERARGVIAPLKLRGEIAAGKDRFVIDRVRAESDRKAFEGRLAYTYARGDQAAKLDAALNAHAFDVDGAIAFFNAAFSGSSFTRPGDIALAIDIGRMTFAGIEANAAKANVRLDAGGLRIDKLSIGDFGGAAVNASGQIDISSVPPRGAISLSLAAQKIDGIVALVRKVSPDTADALTRYAARLSPATIDATIRIDPQRASAGAATIGKLSLDGRLGGLRVTMGGDAAGSADKLADTHVKLTARIGSDDGALLTALGLDRVLAPGKRPASLIVAANGPISGDLNIEAKLAGEGLDSAANGTLHLAASELAGKFALTVTATDLRGLRRDPAALPLALKSNVAINGRAITFSDVNGKVGATPVQGQLAFDATGRATGHISADMIDAASLVAVMVGTPPPAWPAAWPSQPFSAGPLADFHGQIELDAAQAVVLPSVLAQKLHATIGFAPSAVSFDNVTGTVGNGSLSAKAKFSFGAGGLSVNGRVSVVDADAGNVIRAGNSAPFGGKFSSQVEFDSTGSTPAALIGALRGNGSVTLEKAQIAGLDTRAIDVAVRAVERGMPIAAPRIAEIAARVMDNSTYSFAKATAPFEIVAGRARLGKLALPASANNLIAAGSIDLVEETLDARFTLMGSQTGTREAPSQRPEISVAVKGPIASPRRSLDVSPLIGWLTLQAVDREAKKLEIEEREARRRERLNAEIEERLRRATASPEALPPSDGGTSENPPAGSSPASNVPQANAPARRPPSGIEAMPLAP